MFHLGFFLPRFAPLLAYPQFATFCRSSHPFVSTQLHLVSRKATWWPLLDALLRGCGRHVPARGRRRLGWWMLAEFHFKAKRSHVGATRDLRCWYSVCRVLEIPWGVVATYMRHTTGHVFFTGASASFPIRYKPSPDRYDLIKAGISNCEQSASVLSACNEHFLLSERSLD